MDGIFRIITVLALGAKMFKQYVHVFILYNQRPVIDLVSRVT
jgi:hypothetical protein